MKKVAVLYIATGKYVRLWPGFLESADHYDVLEKEQLMSGYLHHSHKNQKIIAFLPRLC